MSGQRTYVNVKIKSEPFEDETTVLSVPEYCTLNGTVDCLEIGVPTGLLRNSESVTWQLRIQNEVMEASCMNQKVSLDAFGICAHVPLKEPFPSAAIASVQFIKICKGTTWHFGTEPEMWSVVHDATSQ